MSIYDVLATRRDEFIGYRAPVEDVQRLEAVLAGHDAEALIRAYRELDICGMGLAFVIADRTALAPGPDFGEVDDDWIAQQEHCFYWTPPRFILRDLASLPVSRAALAGGHLKVGVCAYGGDPYVVRVSELAQPQQALWRIYWPRVDPEGDVPVPPEALTLVCPSLADVVRVALFEEPYLE